jgi:glutamyl-Q tRNA(Asp) synthetase
MQHYVGRFAPSPSGPLHFGSLIAAVASYLDAKYHHGDWLLRIDDLDPPREVAGAAQQIIASLRDHGLDWDGEICWQGQRAAAYSTALAELEKAGHCYGCDCSRAQLAGSDGIYPGNCRERGLHSQPGCATRIRVNSQSIVFNDLIQALQCQRLDRDVGDFVVQRKDGLAAYQLAVVVDDAAAGITHIIRGADLLDSTARQIYLQQLLQLPTPIYGHFPVASNGEGQKLSKQNLARGIDSNSSLDNVLAALRFLGQKPPQGDIGNTRQLLQWAAPRWRRDTLPRGLAIAVSGH